MGCDSSYMRPTDKEVKLQDTAKFLCYVYTQLGRKKEIDSAWEKAAADCYCSLDLVPTLCDVLSALDEKTLDRIVYEPKNKVARRLADWWEEHVEADRVREKAKQDDRKNANLREAALDKLSLAEKKALGLK